MIFKITTGTCVLKTNFYTHKKKSPVSILILKFLSTTPNSMIFKITAGTCFKSELLDPSKEKSRTCCNFKILDHDHQLDMKF